MFIVKTDNTWRERSLVLAVGIAAGLAAYATIGIWWVMLIAQVAAFEAANVFVDLRRARQGAR